MTDMYEVREYSSVVARIGKRVTYFTIMDRFGWSHGIGYATREECQTEVDRLNGHHTKEGQR